LAIGAQITNPPSIKLARYRLFEPVRLIFDELVPGSSDSDISRRISHDGTFNDQHNL
jgi:hypothetical protein